MKRLFDLLLIFLSIPWLLPVFLVLFLLVWKGMGWPAFYSQKRPGLKGRPFTMYKFRSMTNEKDADGNLLPAKNRLTPFGRFIRSTSLDELPELYNVIKGDMSLVGPRPLRMEYLSHYSEFQAQRHDVRPGITGWAQVNGRNTVSWDERFKLDVHYVKNHNLLFDIRVLIQTILKIVKREGVNTANDELMEPFSNTKLNG